MVQTKQRTTAPDLGSNQVSALVRHFEMYERARRAIEKLSPPKREAALIRGLQSGADSRSVVLAALILHSEQRQLDEAKIA